MIRRNHPCDFDADSHEGDDAFDDSDPALADGFHEVPAAELDRDADIPPAPIDYAPLIEAARQAGTWCLEVARSRTTDPVDLEAIDRVQTAMKVSLGGARSMACGNASEEDILVVLGLVIHAFEIDFRIPELGALAGSLYDAADGDINLIKRHLIRVIADRAARQRVKECFRNTCGDARADARRRTPIVIERRPRVAFGPDDRAGTSAGSILIFR